MLQALATNYCRNFCLQSKYKENYEREKFNNGNSVGLRPFSKKTASGKPVKLLYQMQSNQLSAA